jgi:chromosome segregation ATPase
MDGIINVLVPIAVAIGAGIAAYLKASRKQTQQGAKFQTDKDQLSSENVRLQKQVSDMGVILDDLRSQVAKLVHYQELYGTLKEAHDMLKRDHEELKAKFDEKAGEWQRVNTELATERERRGTLEHQNAELFEANKMLAHQVAAYERVFKIQGALLRQAETKADKTAETAGEVKADPDPEKSEGKSEEKTQ